MKYLASLMLLTAIAAFSSGGEQPAEGFVQVDGKAYRLPDEKSCSAIVLIFFGHDCPISNGYAPEIIRLEKEFAAKRVAFCIVYADADLAREAARKHAKEYGFTCPAILDPKLSLARKVGATIKPEAAILSPKGELLYRGRIDDINVDFGKRRLKATVRDLKDALAAVLANKPVPAARTKAIGCEIDFPKTEK